MDEDPGLIILSGIIATVLLLVVGSIAAGPAAAQTDDDPFGGVLDEDSTVGSIAQTVIEATGGLARVQDRVSTALDDDPATATDHADAFEATVEGNNDTIRTYANERLTLDSDDEVFRIYVHDRDGGNETRYVVTSANDGNWTDGPRVLTQSEFDATDRSVNHWISLDWYASKHADDATQTFVTDYAATDTNVSSSYRLEMVSKYGDGIKSDLWGDTSPEFED